MYDIQFFGRGNCDLMVNGATPRLNDYDYFDEDQGRQNAVGYALDWDRSLSKIRKGEEVHDPLYPFMLVRGIGESFCGAIPITEFRARTRWERIGGTVPNQAESPQLETETLRLQVEADINRACLVCLDTMGSDNF